MFNPWPMWSHDYHQEHSISSPPLNVVSKWNNTKDLYNVDLILNEHKKFADRSVIIFNGLSANFVSRRLKFYP